jgi:hypothetical protein
MAQILFPNYWYWDFSSKYLWEEMKEYFSASRSYNCSWNFTDSCSKLSTSPRWRKSYFPIIDIEILALNIFRKRWKNIFQPADPTILPETPETPALNGAHLRDGVNFIFSCLTIDFRPIETTKFFFSLYFGICVYHYQSYSSSFN